jgi:hypothetical protein
VNVGMAGVMDERQIGECVRAALFLGHHMVDVERLVILDRLVTDGCGPQNYCCLIPTSGSLRRWSSVLISSGSNSAPTHATISSCSGSSGSRIASRILAQPQMPPQS